MTSRTTIVIGAVALAVGAFLVFSSMGAVGEYRDADGYYMSDPLAVDRPSHAIVSSDVDLLRGRWETLTEGSLVIGFVGKPDDVRMRGVPSGTKSLFMGIAPTSAVDEYLGAVTHDEVTDWNTNRAAINEVEFTTHQGTVLPGPPGAETFWVASITGTGPQTLDWTIEPGDWKAVIMNADATPEVTADVAFGALPTWNINAVAGTTLAVGLMALIGGGLLLFFGLRRSSREAKLGATESAEKRSGAERKPRDTSPTRTG